MSLLLVNLTIVSGQIHQKLVRHNMSRGGGGSFIFYFILIFHLYKDNFQVGTALVLVMKATNLLSCEFLKGSFLTMIKTNHKELVLLKRHRRN